MNLDNNYNPLIIIQARMGSTRLPGKSMMPINGKPLLEYLIKTIQFVFPNGTILIATSLGSENDIIREYASSNGLEIVSGSELNVASRFVEALETHSSYNHFIRLCGDSPFFDVDLLKKGKDSLALNQNYDFITSKYKEGYPMGSNLEIINSKLYLSSFPKFQKPEHFEHVTPYFYEKFEQYNSLIYHCENVKSKDLNFKLSVDTKEDFEKAVYMLRAMNYEPWKFSLEEKFEMIETFQKSKLN